MPISTFSNCYCIHFQKLFLKANTESLQSLRAGDTLCDLCLNLPAIKRARTKVEEALAGKPFGLPVSYAEATPIRNRYVSNRTTKYPSTNIIKFFVDY